MAFKSKSKSKLLFEEKQTVDAKHNNILQSFNEQKLFLPKLKEELAETLEEIDRLNMSNANSPIFNMELQKKIWQLDDRKIALEKEINDIENNTDENMYMLKTGKILSDYYKILEQEKQFASGVVSSSQSEFQKDIPELSTSISSTNILDGGDNSDTTGIKRKCIIDWFTQTPNNSSVFENVDSGKKIVNISKKKNDNKPNNKKTNITQSISNTTQLITPLTTPLTTPETTINKSKSKLESKDAVYEKFMKIVDKNYITTNTETDIFDTCSKCMVEMLLNNNSGNLICPNCGITENIIVDSDKPSFKEPPKEMTSFCYKRINHLNEFLAQFQAKETTDIPEDVYNEILMEIKKERITNMAFITPEKMRLLLKRIKKNDYYEHIPYIINQLNGLPAPVIAPEIEEIIRGMFKAIQIPFEKYCPHKRKNFLSYNYVMYKFFELLELDEYLTCFQLLKSRTKLHQQDQIWKNICQDLNWQFIRSL
jgi:uncharacterized Zn finger protein (UPF0148 family)